MINAGEMYLNLTLLLLQTGNYIKKIVEGCNHIKKGWNGCTPEQIRQNFHWHFFVFY
jgi:hypothetical protein